MRGAINNSSKIKILEWEPIPNDATSWYRGRVPMTYLANKYEDQVKNIVINRIDNLSWADIIRADVLFMQRPCTKPELEMVREAKHCNRPVIVDYDDYLFNLSIYNTTYHYYMDQETQSTILEIMSIADEIWVSTQNLLDLLTAKFPKIGPKLVVIENGHNDIDFPVVGKRPFVPNDVVLWRGGPTHTGDLLYYKDELLEVINTNKHISFYFFGKIPGFINEGIKTDNVLMMKDYLTIYPYQKAVHNLNPMMNLILLEPSEFNSAKSNINQVEGAYAGAYNLDVPKDKFVEKFNYYASKPEKIRDFANLQWKNIRETQLLSQKIDERYERIKKLVS